jgi:hypothetical protein
VRRPIVGPLAGYNLVDSTRQESTDHRRILDFHPFMQSVRDFEAAVMKAAKELTRRPSLEEACVAVSLVRFTRERIEREWKGMKSMFLPEIADRLALIAVDGTGAFVDPDQPRLRKLAQPLQPTRGAPRPPKHRPLGRKSFDVLKVLLDHWLLGHGAVSVAQLVREAGASYPTVAEALERLESTQQLRRHSSRAVELSAFPEAAWSEMVALGDAVRQTQSWLDVTGRPSDPKGLLARLARLQRPGVSVGGVVAARHYDPHFDLHGTPRLDVCVHNEEAHPGDLAIDLDPALQLTQERKAPAVLVIHLVTRPYAPTQPNPKGVRWASPAETLHDLHELGLSQQAEELVTRLRRGRRS